MIRRILATPCLVLLLAAPAVAQTGQINGVITDNTGAIVPGATVKAVEAATGLARDTVAGADGRYNFTSLRPTTYDISAELSGFRTLQRKGVLLQANQNLTVNFALEIGSLEETLTVTGQSPTVDVTSATLSEVVDSKRIVELPLNGRDAATLSTLVPGIVLTTVDRESGKTIPGALRMSTNGTESRQVSFRLDGTSHSDPYYQQNQPFPFPDALQEFSIQTSNYSAAQGNSAGAVVNAVTRSGTNSFHGGAFGYLRDREFTARNYFNPEKDFLKRKQYGGFAGGPILQNKMFFFAGWQGTTIANRGANLVQFGPTDRRTQRQLCHLRRRLQPADHRSADGPAVPRQSDPGLALRFGLGERAEVPAPGDRRRAACRCRGSSARTTTRWLARSIISSASPIRSACGISSITSPTTRPTRRAIC